MLLGRKNRIHTRPKLTRTLPALAVLAVFTVVTLAQEQALQPAEPVAAEPTEVLAEPAQPSTPHAKPQAPQDQEEFLPVLDGQSIQTISFRKDMPIRDALRMLAQLYQKNIVPSAKVDGIVTVSHLYDVTFEEALESILGTHKYEIKDKFIKVYTNEEFMQDKSRFEYASIKLFYINAEEAQKLATPLLSEFGQIGVTSPAKQDTVPGEGGDSLAINDRLVVNDYPENIEKIRKMLAEVDVAPAQVLIEVTVMEATLNEELDFGIDWTTVLGNEPGFRIVDPEDDSSTLLMHQSGAKQFGGIFSVGISIDDVTAALTASETITDKTVLANPKILALNKQAGKLIIGKQEGYRDSTTIASGGNATTEQIEFLESGTVLEFRPFIGKDGLIRMELRPEQSDGSISVEGLPNKTTTEVVTNVMVKDGHTIVLGGLFKEETNLSRTQVPVFGDIPLLGELFKKTGDESKRTELIVLITPHIIQSPEEADGATRAEGVSRLSHAIRKSIHGLSRVHWAEARYRRAVAEYNAGNYNAAMEALVCPYEISPRTHLDAIRLRERILRETQPEHTLERIMLENLEKEQSGKWLRR